MMAKTRPARGGRISGRWILGILALLMLSLAPACVFNEDDDDVPQSTYGWSWEAGSDMTGQMGVYGTKGTASSSNYPGARGYQVMWLDGAGMVWLFGGHAFDSGDVSDELNDLWKYNPTTLEWTWVSGSQTVNAVGSYGVKGTAAPTNVPGARDTCASWRDSGGRLWVFGGFGHDSTTVSGNLNDLWMFDPATLQWTWISGSEFISGDAVYGTKGISDPANTPGARYGAMSWLDSGGAFWLFGGFGKDSTNQSGDLNDLWKFDPAAREWTWVSGSDIRGQAGIYGVKGTASSANVPGAREASGAWRDATGKLWLFGGAGRDAIGLAGELSDMWMYDPAANQWTWVSGSDAANQIGVYGTLGTASASNAPGAMEGPCSWLDPAGKLWMFGGTGYDSSGNVGSLNALWKYDPVTNQWTWVSGSQARNQNGDYSAKGTRYLSNDPGGREYATGWVDSTGNLWLFGGKGYGSSGGRDYVNDLWKYVR
jgi:N-acetylneuraminic acid mutarotase